MSHSITANDADIYVEQAGQGPDVLLIGGLGDTVESWQFQLDGLADRYRLTAFDNRGAGRTAMPEGPVSVEAMADDAAGVLRALDIRSAHVAGFSGGSATAQELALRHPGAVTSLVLISTWARPDVFLRTAMEAWTWLPEAAPSERKMLEAFFLWIYTPRAHEDGMVEQIIEDAMTFPHPQSPEAFRRQLEAWKVHDTFDRLPQISVPTLVVAGEVDMITAPRYGKIVADRIPGAEFVVLPGEAHQPFQESPEHFNAMVDAFWTKVISAM